MEEIKQSQKFKKIATIMDIVGVILIIIGIVSVTSFRPESTSKLNSDDSFKTINALCMAGCIIGFAGGGLSLFLSLPIWFLTASPKINNAMIQLRGEMIEKNEEDIKKVSKKTVDIGTDIGEYAIDKNEDNIKKIVKTIKSVNIEDESTIEKELKKANNLYKKGVITKEEYDAMRKNILNIK